MGATRVVLSSPTPTVDILLMEREIDTIDNLRALVQEEGKYWSISGPNSAL